MNNTIYQCCKEGPDVNQTLSVVHCADTGEEAVTWLQNNGGGVHRNILHNYQFRVEARDEKEI